MLALAVTSEGGPATWNVAKKKSGRGQFPAPQIKETILWNSADCFFDLWSWRELNPRPNRDILCFLHAYSRLSFRAAARPGPPAGALSSKSFTLGARPPTAIPNLAAPLDQSALGRGASEWCLVSAPGAEIGWSTILQSSSESVTSFAR